MSEIQKLPINPKVPLERRAWAERVRVGSPVTLIHGSVWKAASVVELEKADDGLITAVVVLVHDPGPAAYITKVNPKGERLRFTWRAQHGRFALEGGPAVGQGYAIAFGHRDEDRREPTKRGRVVDEESAGPSPNDVM